MKERRQNISPRVETVDERRRADEKEPDESLGLLNFLENRCNVKQSSRTNTDDLLNQLTAYLNEPLVIEKNVDGPTKFDPIEYWCKHATSSEILKYVAKKSLIVCASSVASERIFSSTGYLIDDRRSNLSSKNVNTYVDFY